MIETHGRIVQRVRRWRAEGRRIGFTNGCFDILHSGHLSTLRLAASHCDWLIVGIDDDASVRALKGEGRPLNKAEDRAALVSALRMVDVVVVFSIGELDALIAGISPDVLVKGDEYLHEVVVGADHAGQVLFASMVKCVGTTELIRRLRASPAPEGPKGVSIMA